MNRAIGLQHYCTIQGDALGSSACQPCDQVTGIGMIVIFVKNVLCE